MRFAYKIPRKHFATEKGIMEYKKGKAYLHTLFINANSVEQAKKRIRKTNDNFIFIGEVDEHNRLIKQTI